MKRAIIVDDEKAAIHKLEKMLNATGDIQILGAFLNPLEAIAFVKHNNVEIAFLDIEMPKISGLELADRLMEIQNNINVIFVTAYSDYAVEAFRFHALDYLLKPVEKERLSIALQRIPESKCQKASASGIVHVNCFGQFKVTIDGQTLKFRTAKAEELFAYLIDNNGKAIHRNYIMDAFWMDYDGDRALILFNTTLHYLKKAFLNYGINLNIIHQRGTYRLDMTNLQCDALEFENRIRSLGSVCNQNLEEFEQTVGLYTGDYLRQNGYEWAMQRVIEFKELYTKAMINISDYYLAAGQISKAIDIIKKAVTISSFERDLILRLLQIFKYNNDKVSLKKYYDLYKARLDNE